jgi:hypothetical protein
VIAVYYGILRGRVRQGVPVFLVMVAVVVPLTIVFARLFATVFETPFRTYRGWAALRGALVSRRLLEVDDVTRSEQPVLRPVQRADAGEVRADEPATHVVQ